MSAGSEFDTEGAATRKPREAKVAKTILQYNTFTICITDIFIQYIKWVKVKLHVISRRLLRYRITRYSWTAVYKYHRRNPLKWRQQPQHQRKLRPSFRFRSIFRGDDGRKPGSEGSVAAEGRGTTVDPSRPARSPALTAMSAGQQRHLPLCSVSRKLFFISTM